METVRVAKDYNFKGDADKRRQVHWPRGRDVCALRAGQGGGLKLRGHDCSHAKPETLAVMRPRDNRTVPAEEAAGAALPYGLRIQSLSHYHFQNKHVFFM